MGLTASLRRAGARARVPPHVPEAFHAPLFHDVVANLDDTKRYVVLDLGAASTATLALLGRSRCRVEIVDLVHFAGIKKLNSAEPGESLASTADAMLPRPQSGDAFDVVLCWDLPNYLTLSAMSALMDAIKRRARPGAVAHFLIFYAHREMPEHPGRIVPAANGELVDLRAPGDATLPAPRYSPEQIGDAMGHFQIDRARLLSNGMQEFVFQLEM